MRIGFLSDISQRTSDAGHEGRNAAALAIEAANASGGIRARRVELLVEDSGQTAEAAAKAAKALIDAGVDAIIGAFTSTAAQAALPLVNAARVLMVSPMASSTALVGLDDYLVRTDLSTRDSAQAYARHLAQRGIHSVAVAYDQRNPAYSETWLAEFRTALSARQGTVLQSIGFGPQPSPTPGQVANALLAAKPQGLLFITSAFDAAHLALQVRRQAPEMPLAATGWAATPTLLQLGGPAVEGLLVVRAFDADDSSPGYQGFLRRFQDRFAVAPGFTAASVYEATSVLLQALERAQPGESPRDALLKHGPYDGLQQTIAFDRFGDTRRTLRFSEARDGRFQPLP